MQLEGQIRDIDIVDRLVELWREKFTGAFRFEQDGVIKILYFKGGDVLSASTNDRTDSVDEILLRGGAVSAKTPDFDEAYRRLGLNEDADDIVNELDGEKSAADVAAAAGKDAFNVYKLIEALRALGLVTRVERTHGAPEVAFDDFEAAGVSDASDVFETAPEIDLAPTMEAPLPADVPLVAAAATPAVARELEPEPQWGFDEAQL